MRLLPNLLAGLTIVGILAASQIASAGTIYPETLNGTSWSVWVNNSYRSQGLTIYQTGSANGCNEIYGNIMGEPMSGFYCNDSGQIGFIRQRLFTGELYQYYRGTLNGGASCGQPWYLSGSFMAWNTVANGTPGEFSFFAMIGPQVC